MPALLGTIILMGVALITLWSGPDARAQSGSILTGKRVMQRASELTLQVGNETVVLDEDIPIFRVERIDGPWLLAHGRERLPLPVGLMHAM